MWKPSTSAPTLAIAGLVLVGGITGLPLLAIASGSHPMRACASTVEVKDDGTPSILGPTALTATDLRTWWNGTGRGQPSRLAIDIHDLIAIYLSEAAAEGVRGDRAFAQAVAETGYFTNSDTAINNFAGIAHYDGSASGDDFADPVVGVRAHIQLLTKYAAGNETALTHTDVSPDTGATATTWGGLAGTWASSPTYWELISSVYDSMLANAGGPNTEAGAPITVPVGCPADAVSASGSYALPVERRWYDEHPDWFSRPHHDYPAVDIPVPSGTPLFAVTSGVIVSTPTGGRCGIGVVLNGDDGAQYTYCHGLAGSHTVSAGDRVTVGQYLMDSASTGNSTGPHLHLAVKTDSTARCPQALLVAIADASTVDPHDLASGGCTY